MKDNNIFSRFEFKYLIKNSLAREIEGESKHFMNIDNYAKLNSNNKYLVKSLYFDNLSHTNFYEKVDGVNFRKKFRLRTYSNALNKSTDVFLEIKGRNQDKVFKKRTKINSVDTDYFTTKINTNYLLKKYQNNEIVTDFVFDVLRKRVKPMVLVDYQRKPFINKYGLYFRLTFDSELITSKTTYLFNDKNFINPIKWKPDSTILEVKFERSLPAWFNRIVQSYSLEKRSISKFVVSMCNLKIAEETSD